MAESMTIMGNVGSEPQQIVTAKGVTITKFRVGCTHRVYDAEARQWVDKYTNWYQVSTFRQLAEHAFASLGLGDSVIVTGRVIQRSWEANGRTGTAVDLEADSVGHDLRWGTAQWRRRAKTAAAEADDPESSDAVEQTAASDPSTAHVDENGWAAPGGLDDEPASAERVAANAQPSPHRLVL